MYLQTDDVITEPLNLDYGLVRSSSVITLRSVSNQIIDLTASYLYPKDISPPLVC